MGACRVGLIFFLVGCAARPQEETSRRPQEETSRRSPPGDVLRFRAEILWSRAEHARDPALASFRWAAAARAFAAVVDQVALPREVRGESAYAAVVACRNALAVDTQADPVWSRSSSDLALDPDRRDTPLSIPQRHLECVAAGQRYVQFLSDADSDRIMIEFLEARTYWQFHHYARSAPAFLRIAQAHPEHEAAGYSVWFLVDSLVSDRDELRRVVTLLRANQPLLAENPDLIPFLERVAVAIGP